MNTFKARLQKLYIKRMSHSLDNIVLLTMKAEPASGGAEEVSTGELTGEKLKFN